MNLLNDNLFLSFLFVIKMKLGSILALLSLLSITHAWESVNKCPALKDFKTMSNLDVYKLFGSCGGNSEPI